MRWRLCHHHHRFQNIAAATKTNGDPFPVSTSCTFILNYFQLIIQLPISTSIKTMDPATGISAPHLTAKEKYTAAYNKTRDSKKDRELNYCLHMCRCSLVMLGNMPNSTKANLWRPESSSLHPTRDVGNNVSPNLDMQTHRRRGSFLNRTFGGFRGCAAR